MRLGLSIFEASIRTIFSSVKCFRSTPDEGFPLMNRELSKMSKLTF